MQKFGLNTEIAKSHRYDVFRDLELDLLKEQSSALGRAGRMLKESIDRFQTDEQGGFAKKTEKEHPKEIGSSLYTLILQREVIGFSDSNIK
jgi:hypothetical protein